ncbi:MAG: FISUMP domain-containing protein, partial [Candidatus Gracilibacteria bacterium]|nr:FISUMP domain-containing protein [Candidatus Gracilibacteria bacterium]
ITTDPSITELQTITEQKRRSLFSINNKTNLPGNIIEKINTGILGEGFVVTAEEIYENGAIQNTDVNGGETSLLLYEGTIEDLSNETTKTKVGENIISYYTGVESTLGNLYQDISSSDGEVVLDALISNRQGGLNSKDIALSSNTGNTQTLTGWRALDPNCDIPDITIGTQTWAGCNSTLGNGFEWGQIDTDIGTNNYNGTVITCYDYNGNNTGICTKGDVSMASNSKANTWFSGTNINGDSEYDAIWGKLYTWVNSSSACHSGRHVPSDAEWEVLETTLNGGINCRNVTNGFLCDGLGWKSNTSYIPDRKLADLLKIPLAGLRNTNGYEFHYRGQNIYLWSRDDLYFRITGINYSTINRVNFTDELAKNFGLSVRCIKN